MSLRVTQPGLFSSIQDLGRAGFMRIGVPPSGALDQLSLRAGNAVLGNDAGEAALEMCRLGVSLVVECDAVRFALVGAEADATLDGRALPFWRTHTARRGQALAVGRIRGGAAYVCVQGGFDLAPSLGSRSTYARAGIGGLHGRRLAADDALPLRAPYAGGPERALPHPPPAERARPLRVVLGPQAEMFTDAAFRTLLTEAYEVTRDADRLGLRLRGAPLEFAGRREIVSDANTTGCIQVPGDGQPIALLPDRQSVGGYAKIATVITADLHRLGQAVPGSVLRFEAVAPEQAEAALWMQARALAATIAAIRVL